MKIADSIKFCQLCSTKMSGQDGWTSQEWFEQSLRICQAIWNELLIDEEWKWRESWWSRWSADHMSASLVRPLALRVSCFACKLALCSFIASLARWLLRREVILKSTKIDLRNKDGRRQREREVLSLLPIRYLVPHLASLQLWSLSHVK